MRPRVLLAITVYNGREVVLRCLRSAALLSRESAEIDVLVLDDCSPAPGWSEELETACARLGMQYYRSPRNLGIVRNVNLGLGRALQAGYDAVIISNSDVVYPRHLIDRFVAAGRTDPTIGSMTAWSTNVSVYSLPHADPDRHLSAQDAVDHVSGVLAAEFGTETVDIPAGISFCIWIPTRVLRRVGLMDPVFGRGYCEETDWSLRSLQLGYRLALLPGVFVYHEGRASTAAAGMLAAGHTTVPANERVVDLRHPRFRAQVAAFLATHTLDALHERALTAVLRERAEHEGVRLDVGWLPPPAPDDGPVRCTVPPAGSPLTLRMEHRGVVLTRTVGDDVDLVDVVTSALGAAPARVRLGDRGVIADRVETWARAMRVPVEDSVAYPTRV